MGAITTHVLNTTKGLPGKNIKVNLQFQKDDSWETIGEGITNDDGRVQQLISDHWVLKTGVYKITFLLKSYYQENKIKGFYPEASICFEIENPEEHFHVPLLISGYGYSTYRGS
jgi:hydroxyisourate hydrolase